MNYGLFLSAAGAMTSMHRQDVHANNLANLNTVGFKPDLAVAMQRLPKGLGPPGAGGLEAALADPHALLEALGGGQFISPTRIDLSQGDLAETGNPLDLAIMGEGFFVVDAGENRAGFGPPEVRLTRDGRFTLNTDGEIVLAASGQRVLDIEEKPIEINPALPVRVDADGEITQDGEFVARLQFVSPTDPSLLSKAGGSLLRLEGGPQHRVPATGGILQGRTESSAVNPIAAMNSMIGASKAVSSNAAMMQYHDHIMGQAINTMGRVA